MDIVVTFAKYFKAAPAEFTASFRRFDKKAQKRAGTTFIRLNGCPKCNHVYLPEDRHTSCPRINENGVVCQQARYDEDGAPYEVLHTSHDLFNFFIYIHHFSLFIITHA